QGQPLDRPPAEATPERVRGIVVVVGGRVVRGRRARLRVVGRGHVRYPPWVWSTTIPAAMRPIASRRAQVNGSCRAMKPTIRTSAVDVPPTMSEEERRSPRS